MSAEKSTAHLQSHSAAGQRSDEGVLVSQSRVRHVLGQTSVCVCVWDLSWHPVPVEHPAPLLEDGIHLHTEWANEYQGRDRSVRAYANHALVFDFHCLLCYNTSAASEQLKVLEVIATVFTELMSRSHLTLSSFLQTRQCVWQTLKWKIISIPVKSLYNFFLMFLEEVSSAHLGCIYLIRNTVKYNKKSNIVKYYNITDSQV